MDAVSLKKHIYENNKIEYVLQEIGCGNIKYHSNKEFYSCSNYNGNNSGAVNVKNCPQLWVTNWTRPNEFGEGSDIFDLVQYNKKCTFVEAIKYLHEILGLEYSPYKKGKNKEKKIDPLYIFKRVLSYKKRVNVDDINMIDESVLDEYIPILHIDWFREGIMPWTAKKFGLAYSYKHKRVVIPHRYWLTGQMLGMNMRTTVQNYEEFGIKKYYLTSGMNKSINLYGLYENYNTIKDAGYVCVYEAEKSVLKRDSLCDSTGVALSGHIMSDEQARILNGLNVEIVICLDKDVSINEVRSMCEKFYRIKNVSYVYDKWDLLDEKQSPADASKKIFDFMFKYRVKYDYKEHQKYLDSLNK